MAVNIIPTSFKDKFTKSQGQPPGKDVFENPLVNHREIDHITTGLQFGISAMKTQATPRPIAPTAVGWPPAGWVCGPSVESDEGRGATWRERWLGVGWARGEVLGWAWLVGQQKIG